ncbi:hypothetical protein CBL_11432 [Carabus blaptoides fortunei]
MARRIKPFKVLRRSNLFGRLDATLKRGFFRHVRARSSISRSLTSATPPANQPATLNYLSWNLQDTKCFRKNRFLEERPRINFLPSYTNRLVSFSSTFRGSNVPTFPNTDYTTHLYHARHDSSATTGVISKTDLCGVWSEVQHPIAFYEFPATSSSIVSSHLLLALVGGRDDDDYVAGPNPLCAPGQSVGSLVVEELELEPVFAVGQATHMLMFPLANSNL